MPDELRIHTCFPVDLFLEWQDHEHLVYKFVNLFNASFSPPPHLRADVVNDRNARVFDPPCKPKIEIREIDQDRCVWRFLLDALGEPTKDTVQMTERTQRFERSDYGRLTDVTFKFDARVPHAGSAQAVELCIAEFAPERP